MEANVEAVANAVALAETDLRTAVTTFGPAYTGLEYHLAKYRDACVNFIFLDWRAAASKNVEIHLWDNHGRVNSKFRAQLAVFRKGEGKKKHIERRKAEKLYLDFIKSSMRFYRGFIQRLASHFKNVPEVFEIARKFNLDTLSADSPVAADLGLKLTILQSCHATLIHLGDLSRYRETELNQKRRNWGPAKGYYDLARALDPASGQSFNQLAVISLADNDHLRAVYYLYRALHMPKAAPEFLGNLNKELKNILKSHQLGTPLLPAEQPPGISNALLSSFLVYHAACYANPSFPDHEDQQKALLAQFATEVKTKPFDSAFRKMSLINIAAGAQATDRSDSIEVAEKSKVLKLRTYSARTQSLNMGTFRILLDLLSEELRVVEQGNAELSPCTRRLLPLLRLYNGWLLSNVGFLMENQLVGVPMTDFSGFWTVYAKALNLLVAAYRIQDLPQAPYLLDEDQDTVNFTAFSVLVRKLHFEDTAGSLKPDRGDPGLAEPLDTEQEMLYRIRQLVIVGMQLHKHKHDFGPVPVPLDFAGGQFHCTIGELSEPLSQPPESHQSGTRSNGLNQAHSLDQVAGPIGSVNAAAHQGHSESEPIRLSNSQSQSPAVKAHTQSPDSRPSSSTFTAQDLVRQIQQPSPTPFQSVNGHALHRTSLPSIFQTPFTPLPGEIPDSGSRPGTAYQVATPSTAPVPPSRGTIEFQQQIAHMQHNIQARTSPIAPLDPTPSSYYETPTGLNTFVRNQPDSSPWERSMTTPSIGDTEIPKQAPRASPFGAIGETRPKSAKTPTSGQSG